MCPPGSEGGASPTQVATRCAQRYIELLDAFLCGKSPAAAFQERYLDAWSQDRGLGGAEVDGPTTDERDALEELFHAVNDFCADDDLFDSRVDLDEESLRERAKVAIRRLQG